MKKVAVNAADNTPSINQCLASCPLPLGFLFYFIFIIIIINIMCISKIYFLVANT